jgi:transcriptional regulator with XRE-family HTH domain
MASKKDGNSGEIEKEIGQAIVMLRRQANLTQEDLAGKAELDRSYLSEIESGKKNISVRILKKIASALGIKASKLLGE